MENQKESYEYAAFSSQGGRAYNEDCILVKGGKDQWLFILADGLGGMGGGKIASSAAVKSVEEWFEKTGNMLSLRDAMINAHDAVLQEQTKNPDASSMSSTLILLAVCGQEASWAHIGDSRLYMFRDGKICARTEDHSIPQLLVRMGELTPEEIRFHPERNHLLRALGSDPGGQEYTVSAKINLKKGDSFLLCSDGFWELIREEEMEQALEDSTTTSEWMEVMRRKVERNSRSIRMDNYSAICVRKQE